MTSRHDTQILDRTATNGLQQMFYSFVKFYDGEYVMMIGWRKGKPSLVSYLSQSNLSAVSLSEGHISLLMVLLSIIITAQ